MKSTRTRPPLGALAASLLLVVLVATAPALADPDPSDRRDYTFVERGFLGTRADPLIKAADGNVVLNLDAFAFTSGPAAATVNPSLWRQAQLLSKHGLFEVVDGVYQVRGFDISNITFIEGEAGWIIIDPLTTTETAAAAYALVSEKLGQRPVSAVIYTHSHVDHFGGARGVLTDADLARGVPIIAPKGFIEEVVSENVIAGPAMMRRGMYQFAAAAPRAPDGYVSVGIGLQAPRGTVSLVPPTIEIEQTGQTLTLDGVMVEFQMTPGTEAPAEMNIYLPKQRVLDLAENASPSLHNILTPRGAQVRDSLSWSVGLGEALSLYGARSDVVMMSHGWPRFGGDEVRSFIANQRDLYKFLHDQSVRMMNQGMTPDEIANRIELPPGIADEWYSRGYYGNLSFNARAVYQRYMGWFDSNPVNLQPFEPAEEARRYVEAMGGRDAVVGRAEASAKTGDVRWASELLNRVVFADPSDMAASTLLAQYYEQLAYPQENGVWRNIYLTGAAELINGPLGGPTPAVPPDYLRVTPTVMLLDLLATRLDPNKAGRNEESLVLRFPERQEAVRLTVRNAVLTYDPVEFANSDGAVTLSRAAFLGAALGGGNAPDAGLARMLSWFDPAGGQPFPIVSPTTPLAGAAR